MLGIPLGFLTANIIEWVFHKHVLHGLGKNKNSIWSSHWHTHHKFSRKNEMIDNDYKESFFILLDSYELKSIIAGSLVLLPFAKTFPWFITSVIVSGCVYYIVHRRSHLDSEWAKKYLPWHYDHHMGKNQDCNWNVTLPIADYILGTRVKNPSSK